MKANNETRKMVDFIFGFENNENYGCNYDTLISNLDISEVLRYVSGVVKREWAACYSPEILYAVVASCKDIPYKDKWEFAKNYNLYIRSCVIWRMGSKVPAIAVDFKIEKKESV